MIANYSLKPSELTSDFIEHLKQRYRDDTINITIQKRDNDTNLIWLKANEKHFLDAYSGDDSIYDDL
ncbi:MAG: hypothetical protein VSS52_002050 [Thiotrichaceae bacterium]|nr:hypothetical protein [Thiotrichaceae bacterium]